MIKLTVIVTWISGPILHTRSATTYVGRDGVQNYVWHN